MSRLFAFWGLALVLASVHAAASDDIFSHFYSDENKAAPRVDNMAVGARAVATPDLATREEVPRLFYLPDEWVDYYADLSTTLYPRSFQIPSTGLSAPKFKVVGGYTANVSDTGLVLPEIKTWYCVGSLCTTRVIGNWEFIKHEYSPGVSNISVTDGGVTQYYLVNVTDYADYFAYNKMSNALSQIIQNGMTEYQKLEAVTRWVAENLDYGVNRTTISTLILESGDYYGLSKVLAAMAQMAGLNASTRRAGQDPGEHRGENVLAIIDGKFIVADAGFSANGKTRPREYALYELDNGFSMYGNYLVQYDGWNKSVRIPNLVNNTEVHGLGRKIDVSVFQNDIEEVYLPATLKTHIDRALDYHITGLKWIEVDPLNQKYSSENGVLYMNNKTTLVLAPRKLDGSVTIHENTTTLAITSMAYRKQPKLVIPSHVTSLNQAAFFYANISEITIEPGLRFLGEACFKYTTSKKVVLPDTVNDMDEGPFYMTYIEEVVLSKNIKRMPSSFFQESWVYKVVIPNGVEVIGGRSFYNTHNIVNITLPTSLKSIYLEAFSSSSIKDIYYEGTQKEWCNITMVTPLPKSITVHFSNGDSVIGPDACNETSSNVQSSGAPDNSESKPGVSSIHTSTQSGNSAVNQNASTTFLSDGKRKMISAVFVLFTVCICLAFH